MSFNISLDFITGIVDLIEKKYKQLTNHQKKNKLNEIANQISVLVVNKTKYLAALKKVLTASKDEKIDLFEVQNAIQIAKNDTQQLNAILKEHQLDAGTYTFSLKNGLEQLTAGKSITIAKLEDALANHETAPIQLEELIKELEGYEKKWIALGKEIDAFIAQKF